MMAELINVAKTLKKTGVFERLLLMGQAISSVQVSIWAI